MCLGFFLNNGEQQTWTHCIVKLAPFVQPYFSYTSCIVQHNFGDTTRECIRRFVTKNVADMRARNYFQRTATLPYLNSDQQPQINSLAKQKHKQFYPKTPCGSNILYTHYPDIPFRKIHSLQRLTLLKHLPGMTFPGFHRPKYPCLHHKIRFHKIASYQ